MQKLTDKLASSKPSLVDEDYYISKLTTLILLLLSIGITILLQKIFILSSYY